MELPKSPFEEALVSRRVASVLPGGRVSIIEVWDLKHPRSPWVSFHRIDEPFLHQRTFATQEQFAKLDIDLK